MFGLVCYTIFRNGREPITHPGGALAPGVRVKSDGGAAAPLHRGPFYRSDRAKNTGGGPPVLVFPAFYRGDCLIFAYLLGYFDGVGAILRRTRTVWLAPSMGKVFLSSSFNPSF